MFTEEFLERIFDNKEMQKIPVGCQSTAVHAFEEILKSMLEVNPYESLSELFTNSGSD